jgi:dolichol-phosphate mannosyltransferase
MLLKLQDGSTIAGELSVNTYARWALGLAPRDCSGAFRCYRVSLLEQLDLMQVRSRGYAFQEEILWHLKRVGARVGESPIVFTDRQYGRSKINAQEALTALWVIFVLGLRNLFYRRAKKAAGETSMSEAPPAAATKQR